MTRASQTNEQPMDAKRLLAEATALELREDAICARAAAKRETALRTQAALSRLAALAEAVAALDTRHAEYTGARYGVRWDVVEPTGGLEADFVPLPATTPLGGLPTLCAALSTLLPTEDTTDGR